MMVPDGNAIMLFRFSEQRWADAIIAGTLSFSCAGAFIHQAKRTGNDVQGDKYEGIFARLKKGDPRIQQMRESLSKDLTEISDGDFVLLKRKSAMKKPIFCFYGYKAIDALEDCGENLHIGLNHIPHEFDPRMYEGFAGGSWDSNVVADDRRFTMLILRPDPFVTRVNVAAIVNKLSYRMRAVDYKTRESDIFFIPPTYEYDELFCKHPKYAYQYEVRICLTGITFASIFDRYPLNIGALTEFEYRKEYQPLKMVLQANIGNRKTLSPEEQEVLAHD